MARLSRERLCRGWGWDLAPRNKAGKDIWQADSNVGAAKRFATLSKTEARCTLPNEAGESFILQDLLENLFHLAVHMPRLPKIIDGARTHVVAAQQPQNAGCFVQGLWPINCDGGE